MHRSFGNPSLGTLSAFMTVLILIRAGVNLYFTADIISAGKADLNLNQIASGWYFYIAAYIITCSSLSAYHVNFALPDISFLNISPRGKIFRKTFLRQSVILKPMNIVFILLTAAGSIIFISAGGGLKIILSGLLLIGASVPAAALIFKIAGALSIEKSESLILESILLLMLFLMNPDVISRNGSVVMLVQGMLFRFDSAVMLIVFSLCVFSLACSLLIITKFLSVLNTGIRFTKNISPFTGWYWKFFTVRYWFILYLFAIPFMLTPAFSTPMKRRFIVVFILFSAFSFLVFINQCRNNIKEYLLNPFPLKNNSRLFNSTLLLHLVLTLLPLSALFIRI